MSSIFHNNQDIEQLFDIRQKLYEQRSVLSENVEQFKNISDETKEELNIINENVTKGQKLLEKGLDEYKQLVKQKKDLEMFETQGKSTCLECQKMMSHLFINFENENFKTEDITNHIDAVNYYVGQIFELIDSNSKEKNKIVDEKLRENTALLAYLSNTYRILRGTNIGYVCPICMTNEVSLFCDPCGHSYCSKCMNGAYCHMCRKKINTLRPIFFS